MILLVLILILILTIDEAVGEDAAEQEGDSWHVDGDVVDGHLHPSDDSVQTVHSRFSDVFKTLLKAPKAPTDCRLLTCISPHGVYLSLSASLHAVSFIITGTLQLLLLLPTLDCVQANLINI